MKRNRSKVVDKPKRKSTPQGVYWHFTEYDMEWEPPVPYPDGTPENQILIRYLICQAEVCPHTQRDHIQGYVQFYKKKYGTEVQRALKLSPTTHVELERKDPSISINYTSKLDSRKYPEQLPFTYGIPNLVSHKGGRPKTHWEESNSCYAEATNAATKEEALNIIKEKAPRDMWICNSQIISASNYFFPKPKEVYVPEYTYDTFNNVHKEIKEWERIEMIKRKRALCLMICGPTRIGKTEYCRSIKPNRHMYFRGGFSLAEWDDDTDLIILDDIDFKNWTADSAKILITQNGPGILTDKYMRRMTKNVNKPCIILCNRVPQWYYDEEEYWSQNIQLVHVNEKFYKPVVAAPIIQDAEPTSAAIEQERLRAEYQREVEEAEQLLNDRQQQVLDYGIDIGD